jgi:hypothetical protein
MRGPFFNRDDSFFRPADFFSVFNRPPATQFSVKLSNDAEDETLAG